MSPSCGDAFWVTLTGGPDGDKRWPIPIPDLSATPFMCEGRGPDRHHYEQAGDPTDRTYVFVGMCGDLPERSHVAPD